MDELKKVAEKIAKVLAEEMEDEARKEMDAFHPKLGKSAKIYSESNHVIIAVKERPWKFVLFGTKPHLICARLFRQCGRPDPLWRKARSTLVFYWEKVGATVFFKRVHHPGYRPKKPISELRKKLIEIARASLKRVLIEKI